VIYCEVDGHVVYGGAKRYPKHLNGERQNFTSPTRQTTSAHQRRTSSNSRLKKTKTKMKTNLHLLSRGAVFFAASSSFSLPSVVSAAEATAVSSDDLKLKSTRRQLSNSYAGNLRALMRDEQRSDVPDVASIINGTPTGGPLSYQVGLTIDAGLFPDCGGSLIASRVVLTAAHCTEYPTTNKVIINGYDLSSFNGWTYEPNSVIIQASSYVVHPGWNTTTIENDIALWFLPIPIAEDDNFKFATLNDDPTVPADGEELFISGWGLTDDLDDDSKSPILLGTNVDYVTNEQCQLDYDKRKELPNTIYDGMMCAARDGTDSCQCDSGGPLMIANGDGPAMDPPIQVGIISWAAGGCANPNFPGVYTRVSSYIDWIRSTACQEVGELCPSSSKSGKGKSKAYKNGSP
jgi:trypsin